MSPPSGVSCAKVPFSKRPIKPNPLFHNSDHDRERRRNLFLKKVSEESSDQKWKARGGDEEIMRSIYVSEQRRWEAAQARIAKELQASQEEDEDILMMSSSNFEDTGMIDDHIGEESAELEALVSLLESPDLVNNGDPASAQPSGSSDLGSEDEEYDRLFLDLVNQEYNGGNQGTSCAELGSMDTSSG
ncbi:hypothetical protein FGG08_001893 [Glutinoglossum americanum]|uniref:Uncharacterized protein n=1 Tax=Glutinoglossum americanum TaxID=1670608 RepID=A0A9P8IAG1_9PEZI|nr:hypothetical protein FGG08_001893 [Glutinoglossum americanum]